MEKLEITSYTYDGVHSRSIRKEIGGCDTTARERKVVRELVGLEELNLAKTSGSQFGGGRQRSPVMLATFFLTTCQHVMALWRLAVDARAVAYEESLQISLPAQSGVRLRQTKIIQAIAADDEGFAHKLAHLSPFWYCILPT